MFCATPLQLQLSSLLISSVATSPVVLCWLCDSPRTGCAWRITPLCMWREQAIIEWSLLLLAAMVRSSVHMPLGISDRNKMVLWPGCEGRAEFSLHTKNVWSVWFVVKRRGCCCNLSGGVVLIVRFTTNRMCMKNNTIMYVARTSNNRVISSGDLYCCLLPRCEALCTCRSGFPIATVAIAFVIIFITPQMLLIIM